MAGPDCQIAKQASHNSSLYYCPRQESPKGEEFSLRECIFKNYNTCPYGKTKDQRAIAFAHPRDRRHPPL